MRHYVVYKFLFMNFTNNYVLKLLTHVKNNKNMSIYCKTLGHTWLIYVTNDPLQYRTFVWRLTSNACLLDRPVDDVPRTLYDYPYPSSSLCLPRYS